ncbi:peptide-methionine (S)-S-oxide reductase MsrA [Brevundimonas lenta]|uniref:peptide-methionine (S)-S-oxide reductase MsrA n=1 Tax=Brevundimonas lenta TaxID=424796 RepID=UPI003CCD3EDD
MRRTVTLIAILAFSACAESAPPAAAGPDSGRRETAVFAGGCFWSVEANFERIPGVVSAVSGFSGGTTRAPTYDQVVRGGTGHLESVQVTFDPARVSYRSLVDRFWRTIDPTDSGGQFCDRGASYGTAVFVTAAQRPAAEASRRAAMLQLRGGQFATPILAVARFWPAEAYHQDFARRNPVRYAGYSRFCGRAARLDAVWGDAGT